MTQNNAPKGRCPFGNPARGRCPLDSREGPSALSTPMRVYRRVAFLLQGSRRATGAPRRGECGAGVSPLRRRRGIPRLRTRTEGFAIALCTPSRPLPVVSDGKQKYITDFASVDAARRRGTLPAAAAASRNLRVAARPSRAVTPAKERPCAGLPEWVSRGPKALRGVQGQSPWRVVRAAP